MMADDIAIRVENLSKRYRIGAREEVHDTFAGMLSNWVKRPGQNMRRLRGLTSFSENGQEPEDIIWALKDVSFEVKRGEVVGIIGRNGAGKSTLLKILSRITHPTSGRVELNGRISSLLEVGTGFHPELTGRENVYLNGTILGMTKREIESKFDVIVEFSGIEKFIDTPIKRYSSGMGVRLAFSIAAHLEPEILLVDEVLAVGDLDFQRKCLGKMNDVASRGSTVLVVSHNMASILGLCTRSILVQRGKLAYDGDPNTCVKLYQQDSANIRLETSKTHLRRKRIHDFFITSVRLLDLPGQPVSAVEFGRPLRIDVAIQTPANLENFVVGIAIFSASGVYCYGMNTYLDGIELSAEKAEMTVTAVFDEVTLLDGSYAVTVGLYNENGTVPYDIINRQSHFTISSDLHDHGLTYLRHTWQVDANRHELTK